MFTVKIVLDHREKHSATPSLQIMMTNTYIWLQKIGRVIIKHVAWSRGWQGTNQEAASSSGESSAGEGGHRRVGLVQIAVGVQDTEKPWGQGAKAVE